jgi:hypothetical protein
MNLTTSDFSRIQIVGYRGKIKKTTEVSFPVLSFV